jgi:hypothetical protein
MRDEGLKFDEAGDDTKAALALPHEALQWLRRNHLKLLFDPAR